MNQTEILEMKRSISQMKNLRGDWGCSSVEQHLPSMLKVMVS
jgi:hypothetical protein